MTAHLSIGDNLVARLTAPASSALATIAIAGPAALALAESLFQPSRHTVTCLIPGNTYYGIFGEDPTDDVVLAVKPDPMSVEVHCHGGPALVEALIDQVVARGARRVSWREFLQHFGATVVQIEAVEALSRCANPRPAGILLDQYLGSLDAALKDLNTDRARELLSWSRFGLHLVEPWRVLFVGRPNAGKSTLLNALVGYTRAIVDLAPGTTRDLIEVTTSLDGWPVTFMDGAGIRDSHDPIERVGIETVQRAADRVDLVIHLVDLTTGNESPISGFKIDHVVGTKSDLSHDPRNAVGCDQVISAVTGKGLDEFCTWITKALVPRVPPPGHPIPFTSRQIREIQARR